MTFDGPSHCNRQFLHAQRSTQPDRGTSSFPKANPSRSASTHRKQAITNVSAYNLGRRIFMQSRSLWLGSTMSSCSPTMPTRELDSLEESLLVCLCSHSPLVGAFFFYVSGVVTNARCAHSVGASVEELTCTVKTSAMTDAVSLA